MSSSTSSPNSPTLSEPLSPNESNHSNQSANSIENGLRPRSVTLLGRRPSHSPSAINHNHINSTAEMSLSRDTSTPSSIIDPGEERDNSSSDGEYFKPYKKLRVKESESSDDKEPNKFSIPLRPTESIALASPPNGADVSDRPLTSFLIKDILSDKPKHCTNIINSESRGIVRPWDLETSHHHNHHNNHSTLHHKHHSHHHMNNFGRIAPNRRPRSADDDSRSERSESDSPESPASNLVVGALTSPLDALFEMTSKAFDGIDGSEKSSDASADHLNLFSNRASQAKKKRKSRTAFTNHQIFELEKRFLYQKYLSPADRDEIAQTLGLSNAQVITWFQNRRAKLKRDMEELKKDVDAAKITNVHKSLLDNIQDLSLIKKADLAVALHLQQTKAALNQ